MIKRKDGGAVEYDVKSGFSHIRIRKQDSIRTLLFVGQYGDEVVESALDLNQPHHLLVPYSRTMFASYLFKRNQQRVMIVGLGGGSMVHFLNLPRAQTSDRCGGDRPGDRQSGRRVLRSPALAATCGSSRPMASSIWRRRRSITTSSTWMPSRPSPKTDGTGVPIELATAEFLKKVAARVNADGLVVFNLHQHAGVDDDIGVIRSVFPEVYRFEAPTAGNLVVIASASAARESVSTLERRGEESGPQLRRRFLLSGDGETLDALRADPKTVLIGEETFGQPFRAGSDTCAERRLRRAQYWDRL